MGKHRVNIFARAGNRAVKTFGSNQDGAFDMLRLKQGEQLRAPFFIIDEIEKMVKAATVNMMDS